ncbi:hypothetical protein IJU22_01200 [Candidatus Saccharibacteria bacterium]|nr:hypothetical protein [Candidatus Saccharibacteria bacterium]
MDIKNLEAFPTIEHVHEIVRDLGKGNIEAEKALEPILSRIDGVRAIKDLKTELSPDEWAKVYRLCGDDAEMLISSVIVIGCLNDPNHIHENLSLKYPAPFVVQPIQEGEILLGGCKNYAMRRHFRDEFLHRLKVAKRSQP